MKNASINRKHEGEGKERFSQEHLSDALLLKQVAYRRDERAFEVLYKRYERRAYALAYKNTGRRVTAEEVLQEAMLQVWRYASSFQEGGTARRWIFRIVINESRRIFNRSLQRKIREQVFERSMVASPCGDPSVEQQRREDKASVIAAVSRLPAADRKLVTCYFGLGLTQERIALEFKMGPRTISYRLGRILTQLRKTIVGASQ